MMLSVRKSTCPLDYSLCNQIVTVYHKNETGSYTRTEFKNAFLDFKKTQNVDKTGSRESNTFLLVIPCASQCVFVGDKIISGSGPEIDSADGWAALIPAKVPGLVVVRYVDPKYWNGRICHVEAGG